MNVLESLSPEDIQVRVYRLAYRPRVAAFFRERLGDPDDPAVVSATIAELRASEIGDPVADFWDAPFRDRGTGEPSRYSDGSFPVFYGSLEEETAGAEVVHWAPKRMGAPAKPRTAFYTRFSVTFEGTVKDLRAKRGEWRGLTHDSDYAFCNRLGAEAVAAGLDGLLAPSARRDGRDEPAGVPAGGAPRSRGARNRRRDLGPLDRAGDAGRRVGRPPAALPPSRTR